jgi:hypothetical protein
VHSTQLDDHIVPEYPPNPEERPPPSWRPFLIVVIVMAVGWVIWQTVDLKPILLP